MKSAFDLGRPGLSRVLSVPEPKALFQVTNSVRGTRAVPLGGDCLAGIAVLCEQPGLAGAVAPDPVVSWLVAVPAKDGLQALQAIRAVRFRSHRSDGWTGNHLSV
jgi:hypothetical protein